MGNATSLAPEDVFGYDVSSSDSSGSAADVLLPGPAPHDPAIAKAMAGLRASRMSALASQRAHATSHIRATPPSASVRVTPPRPMVRTSTPPTQIVVPAEIMAHLAFPALTYDDYLKLTDLSRHDECVAMVPSKPAVMNVSHVNLLAMRKQLEKIEGYEADIAAIANPAGAKLLKRKLADAVGAYEKNAMNLVTGFELNGHIYTVADPPLGTGSFGTVKKLLDGSGRDTGLCVKMLRVEDSEGVANLINESIMHAILYHTMQTDPEVAGKDLQYAKIGGIHGLCKINVYEQKVPRTGEVAVRKSSFYGVVMERLGQDAWSYIADIQSGGDVRHVRTATGLMAYQVLHTLEFLIEKLKYNHRDLKPNNVMITLTTRHTNSNNYVVPQFYLIDFGMSRMEFNGFVFSGDSHVFGYNSVAEDVNVVPMHDVIFFLFTTLMILRCDDGRVPCDVLGPIGKIITDTMDAFDATIGAKYRAGDYVSTGNKWWAMYSDAHNVLFGQATVDPNPLHPLLSIHEIRHRVADFLRSIAGRANLAPGQLKADAPTFFGRRR